MAITGTVPLSKMQGALEATPGTAQAATRILPILSGSMNQHVENIKHAEQRGSLVRHYRKPVQVKRFVEISGMEIVPTFEELPWYLQLAMNGTGAPGTGVSGYNYNTTAYSYSWAGNDTYAVNQCATLEVGNDTQAWKVTHAVINRLELGWSVGGPATLTVDWLGARAVAGSFTGALSAVESEEIVGAGARIYIDTTTVATTPNYAVQDFKLSIDNHLVQFWGSNGDIYPVGYYLSEPRTMHIEATVAYTANTEYAAFLAGSQRKILVVMGGSAIPGSSPSSAKAVNVFWYGYWDEAPWSDQDGLVVQRFVGDSVYDAGAGADWSATISNALSSII